MILNEMIECGELAEAFSCTLELSGIPGNAGAGRREKGTKSAGADNL